MKKPVALAIAVFLALGLPGCVHVHTPAPKGHPHGAPPGQVKKMYRCGHCGGTGDVAIKCHGKLRVVID
jgi:hypothetical protein